MRDVAADIRALGAEPYAVGNGNAYQLSAFLEEFRPNFPVYTDPSLASYQAAGFKSGLGTIFGRKALSQGISALRDGFMQGKTQGHPFQQGGVLIFAPPAEDVYVYISSEAGDHPKTTALLDALRARKR